MQKQSCFCASTCVHCNSVAGVGSSKVDHSVLLDIWIPVFMQTSAVFLCWRRDRRRADAGVVRVTGVYAALFLCCGNKEMAFDYLIMLHNIVTKIITNSTI